MNLRKTMLNGNYVKVNGKHIMSIGYFAYDGCHKIYVLESEDDVKAAMSYGYRLIPINEIKRVYEESCPLKFIETIDPYGKVYVKQFSNARWSEVKVPEKEIRKYLAQKI